MAKDKMRVLLITPYTTGYKIGLLLAKTLEEIGFEPILISAEETTVGSAMPNSVQRAIERADFIIADISGNNPNVMYEIGYAHAMRKTVLLIVQQNAKRLPVDLNGHLYLVYDPSNLSELKYRIKKWVSHSEVEIRKKVK